MKPIKIFFPALLASLLLCACAAPEKVSTIQVFLEETDSCSASESILQILPGEDAVFTLQLGKGSTLLATDYRGEYEITENGSDTLLTLKDVHYPTRVHLMTASKSGQIRYEGNGGQTASGDTSVVTGYSLITHRRANTALGTDLFERSGYTLVSWNTAADGSGDRIGLGSRITLSGGEDTLYAIWAPWNDPSDFLWRTEDESVTITGYSGSSETLVIPGEINSLPVKKIASGAFRGGSFTSLILPDSLETIEEKAFSGCSVTEITMFDNLSVFSDESFSGCDSLKSLHINACEAPYGYVYRKESCFADKVDLLILNQGHKKMVFYGGCSMWYNLDAAQADKLFGSTYVICNLALNGTVSSAVQMQIMAPYLESGDIFFHTPELSSHSQMMYSVDMKNDDSHLWCGIENNYDLFAAVDLRTVGGVFSSFCHYLSLKDHQTDYMNFYSDDYRTPYCDKYGSIALYRSVGLKSLPDFVSIRTDMAEREGLKTLASYYADFARKGIRVYVSFACVNLDALNEEELDMVSDSGEYFYSAYTEMEGATPISSLEDYCFRKEDFYDTNYHLLSEPAARNTANWMRDLKAQMIIDGLWENE